MFTSSECCAIAEKKLAQAENDGRHRRRLVNAAKSWLFLASRLSRKETEFSIDDRKDTLNEAPKKKGASTNSSRYVRQHLKKAEIMKNPTRTKSSRQLDWNTQ